MPLKSQGAQGDGVPIPSSILTITPSFTVTTLTLDKPRNLEDLAKALDVRKPQLQDWVKELLKEGVLKEQVIRKVKKLVLRKPEEELNL